MKEVYELFEAIRLHLTTNYDFHKYNGKLRKKVQTPQIYLNKLAKIANTKNKLIYFFLWNQILYHDQNGKYSAFIGDFLNDESEKNYKKFLSFLRNFDYNVSSELSSIFEMNGNIFGDGNKIVFLYYSNKLNFVTLMCLYKFTNYKNEWAMIKDPLMMSLMKKLEKTESFFKIDKEKFLNIFTKILVPNINNTSLCNI